MPGRFLGLGLEKLALEVFADFLTPPNGWDRLGTLQDPLGGSGSGPAVRRVLGVHQLAARSRQGPGAAGERSPAARGAPEIFSGFLRDPWVVPKGLGGVQDRFAGLYDGSHGGAGFATHLAP